VTTRILGLATAAGLALAAALTYVRAREEPRPGPVIHRGERWWSNGNGFLVTVGPRAPDGPPGGRCLVLRAVATRRGVVAYVDLERVRAVTAAGDRWRPAAITWDGADGDEAGAGDGGVGGAGDAGGRPPTGRNIGAGGLRVELLFPPAAARAMAVEVPLYDQLLGASQLARLPLETNEPVEKG